MNREELIEYMQIVCDAENILYACDELKNASLPQASAEEIQRLREQTQRQLNHLYGKNLIPPQYRHLIAVHQLCEALETGICDELQGQYGACAAYQWDVQARQICTTVAELKRSAAQDARLTRIGLSMAAMKQGRALREIQQVDRMLQELSSSHITDHPYLKARMNRIERYLSRSSSCNSSPIGLQYLSKTTTGRNST